MKKIIAIAAFFAICSTNISLAQSIKPAETTKKEVAAEKKDDKNSSKSCCSKGHGSSTSTATAKSCTDSKSSAGKSSCCMKGHSDAKVENKAEEIKKN